MKRINILSLLSLVCMLAVPVRAAFDVGEGESVPVRFDDRRTLGGCLVTGSEQWGAPDGSSAFLFDTTQYADGMRTISSDGGLASTNVWVLNNPAFRVEGGRLADTNTVWYDDVTHIVRRQVVIPSGCTLTLTTNTVVKLCPDTGFFIESKGRLNVVGDAGGDVIFTEAFDDAHGAVGNFNPQFAGPAVSIYRQDSSAIFSHNGRLAPYGFAIYNLPTLTVSDATVLRGGGVAHVMVTIKYPNGYDDTAPYAVDWVVTPGTALAGDDIPAESMSGTLSWPSTPSKYLTMATAFISIPINASNVTGEDRSFTVTLVTPHGVNIGAEASATVTITECASTLEWSGEVESTIVRYDDRDTIGGKMVHGTETFTAKDGTHGAAQDTALLADGWQALEDYENNEVNIFALNDPAFAVEGGRLAVTNILWSNNVTHVVRNWVVIPSNCTLSVSKATVVKFAPETGIYIEEGGTLNVIGASGNDVILTSITDDTAGAAVPHDGYENATWEGIAFASSLSTKSKMNDNEFFQVRGWEFDKLPKVSVNDSIAYRSDGSAYVDFTFTRSTTRDNPFSVDWVAVDDTAIFGEDYTLVGGTVRWAKTTDTKKTIEIPLVKDHVTGETRHFKIRIVTARGSQIAADLADVEVREYDMLSIACVEAQSPVRRYDCRETIGGRMVHGVERFTAADGSQPEERNTAQIADGWSFVESELNGENVQSPIFVLNDGEVAVEGGRLVASVTWTSNVTHVIRTSVVIPNGKTLTISPGTVVKFCPGTEIYVEEGGTLKEVQIKNMPVVDAVFTSLTDDTVGAAVPYESEQKIGDGDYYVTIASKNAKFEDTGHLQLRGFASAPGFGYVTVHDVMTDWRNGIIYVPVTVTNPSSGARKNLFYVRWETVDGTARYGEDFTANSGIASWASGGSDMKLITIPISQGGTGDFTFRIATASGVLVNRGEASIKLRDMNVGRMVSDVTETISDVSPDFMIDADVGTRSVLLRDRIDIAYSPKWCGETDTSKLRTTISFKNMMSAKPPATVATFGADETGHFAFDAEKDGIGSYKLVHEITDETGDVKGKYEKVYAVVDDETTVLHAGTLTSNEVWQAGKTHFVYADVFVPSLWTLFIEPGAVVKFATGTSIEVESGGGAGGGAVFANEVVFTHINDDTVGGDTLADGAATSPEMGDYGLVGNVTLGEDSEVRYLENPGISGTIAKSQSLLRNGIYPVNGDITIPNGVTLTIPEGAVLKFAPRALINVQSGGTLNVEGSRVAPVVFTSMKDDSFAGDMNGDGDATSPAAGDWRGVTVAGAANFSHCKILYAGVNELNNGALRVSGSGKSILFNNSEVAHSAGVCVDVNSGGGFAATNSVFRNCATGFVKSGSGSIDCCNCVVAQMGVGVSGSGSVFRNIVFFETGEFTASGGSNNTFEYCLFYNPAGSGAQSFTKVGTSGNLWGDPKFVDAAGGNFCTKAGSACVDAADGMVAPAEDAFGQLRYDWVGVDNSGTATTDGEYADIGIYEAMPRGAMSDIDLVPGEAVRFSGVLRAGEETRFSWEVRNIGGSYLSEGGWYDTLYLVSSEGDSIPVGTVLNDATISGGGSFMAYHTLAVPQVEPGEWYLKLVVNSERDVYEGMATENNVFVSTLPVLVENGAGGNVPGEEPFEDDFDWNALMRDLPDVTGVNAIIGRMGRGNVQSERFVTPGEWLYYEIYFENPAEALTSVAQVKVVMQVPEEFDLNSFAVGEIAFNNQTNALLKGLHSGVGEVTLNDTPYHVRTRVTVDEHSREVRWNLRIADSLTEDGWPTDILCGFLPPNDPATHCGEGFVSFRMKVREGAKSGKRISLGAEIDFDHNDTVVTDPAWWNTIRRKPQFILRIR